MLRQEMLNQKEVNRKLRDKINEKNLQIVKRKQ